MFSGVTEFPKRIPVTDGRLLGKPAREWYDATMWISEDIRDVKEKRGRSAGF